MRWVLVLAFCAGAAATTWAGLREEEPRLRVTIQATTPFPDEEDDQNPITSRFLYFEPPFTVDAPARCDRAEGSSRYPRFFNGQRQPPNGEEGYYLALEGRRRRYAGAADGPFGSPGETIKVTLHVKCHIGGRVLTGKATRDFEVPAASCSGGPLRVLAVSGRARSEDYDVGGSYPLSPGDLVRPGSELGVSSGGELELGAPECNSLRLTFFGGRRRLGGYSPDRRTYSTGRRLLARGDAHGGGWEDRDRAVVVPLAERCHGCGVATGTRYEVRSSARRVTLRVFSGAALLYGGPGSRPARVEDGETASVLCGGSVCAPTPSRFFHEGEPWSTPANIRARRFSRVARGASPPLWKLAPQFARVDAKRLPAALGAPEQIAVTWSRQVRLPDRYGYRDYPSRASSSGSGSSPRCGTSSTSGHLRTAATTAFRSAT